MTRYGVKRLEVSSLGSEVLASPPAKSEERRWGTYPLQDPSPTLPVAPHIGRQVWPLTEKFIFKVQSCSPRDLNMTDSGHIV